MGSRSARVVNPSRAERLLFLFCVFLIVFKRRFSFSRLEIIGAGGGETVEERSRFDVGQVTRVETEAER